MAMDYRISIWIWLSLIVMPMHILLKILRIMKKESLTHWDIAQLRILKAEKRYTSNIPKIPHPLDQPADFRYKDVNLKFVK